MFARSRPQSVSTFAPDKGGARPDLLASAPTLVLGLICLLAIAFVGWAATMNPLQVCAGVALWGLFLLRRRIGALAGRILAPGRAAPVFEAAQPAAREGDPAASFIGADLAMTGRLSGARRVELHGRLSGEVECDAIRVHAGAELRAHVLHDSMEIVPGAIFEGSALPYSALVRPAAAAVAVAPQSATPQSAAPKSNASSPPRLRPRRAQARKPAPAPVFSRPLVPERQ